MTKYLNDIFAKIAYNPEEVRSRDAHLRENYYGFHPEEGKETRRGLYVNLEHSLRRNGVLDYFGYDKIKEGAVFALLEGFKVSEPDSQLHPKEGYFYQSPKPGAPCLMVFHGNGGLASQEFATMLGECVRNGYSLYCPEYNSYAPHVPGQQPEKPSARNLEYDAERAAKFLEDQGIAPRQTVVIGECLGSCAAIHLAAKNSQEHQRGESEAYKGLLAENPMMSSTQLVKDKIDGMAGVRLGRRTVETTLSDEHSIRNVEKMQQVTIPATVIHSTNDNVVPSYQHKEVYQALPEENKSKKLYQPAFEGHLRMDPSERMDEIKDLIHGRDAMQYRMQSISLRTLPEELTEKDKDLYVRQALISYTRSEFLNDDKQGRLIQLGKQYLNDNFEELQKERDNHGLPRWCQQLQQAVEPKFQEMVHLERNLNPDNAETRFAKAIEIYAPRMKELTDDQKDRLVGHAQELFERNFDKLAAARNAGGTPNWHEALFEAMDEKRRCLALEKRNIRECMEAFNEIFHTNIQNMIARDAGVQALPEEQREHLWQTLGKSINQELKFQAEGKGRSGMEVIGADGKLVQDWDKQLQRLTSHTLNETFPPQARLAVMLGRAAEKATDDYIDSRHVSNQDIAGDLHKRAQEEIKAQINGKGEALYKIFDAKGRLEENWQSRIKWIIDDIHEEILDEREEAKAQSAPAKGSLKGQHSLEEFKAALPDLPQPAATPEKLCQAYFSTQKDLASLIKTSAAEAVKARFDVHDPALAAHVANQIAEEFTNTQGKRLDFKYNKAKDTYLQRMAETILGNIDQQIPHLRQKGKEVADIPGDKKTDMPPIAGQAEAVEKAVSPAVPEKGPKGKEPAYEESGRAINARIDKAAGQAVKTLPESVSREQRKKIKDTLAQTMREEVAAQRNGHYKAGTIRILNDTGHRVLRWNKNLDNLAVKILDDMGQNPQLHGIAKETVSPQKNQKQEEKDSILSELQNNEAMKGAVDRLKAAKVTEKEPPPAPEAALRVTMKRDSSTTKNHGQVRK